jgi:hypothetical protein
VAPTKNASAKSCAQDFRVHISEITGNIYLTPEENWQPTIPSHEHDPEDATPTWTTDEKRLLSCSGVISPRRKMLQLQGIVIECK